MLRPTNFNYSILRLFSIILTSLALMNLAYTSLGQAAGRRVPVGYAAVGAYHSLVLDGEGGLWVFGDNSLGQLGIGNEPGSIHPRLLMNNVRNVEAGELSSFVISGDGTLWGFGKNSAGELGLGNAFQRNTPAPVLSRILSVSVSPANPVHVLGLDENGDIWSWGENGLGQLGNGDLRESSLPQKVLSKSSQVLARTGFSLAIGREYSLWIWGGGQPGTSSNNLYDYKPRILLSQVLKIAAGENHCLALRKDDSLWAWGLNKEGEVGDGSFEMRLSPIKILDNITDISAGPAHSLALDRQGRLWGWGANHTGQLGLDGLEKQAKPTLVMNEVAQIFPSRTYTLVLDRHGGLWFMGRLSPPDFPEFDGLAASTPQVLAQNVEFAASGSGHILFIKTDGSLWGLGNNTSGQLGLDRLDFFVNPNEIFLEHF